MNSTARPKPDFWSRVDFVQNYLCDWARRADWNERDFDGCLESYDGELVATAIIRRAAYIPELMTGLQQTMKEGIEVWQCSAQRWRHIREDQFVKVAGQVQRDAKEKSVAQLAAMLSEAA